MEYFANSSLELSVCYGGDLVSGLKMQSIPIQQNLWKTLVGILEFIYSEKSLLRRPLNFDKISKFNLKSLSMYCGKSWIFCFTFVAFPECINFCQRVALIQCSDHGVRTQNKDINQIKIWKFGTMWQTKLYLKILAWECRRFPHWASVVRDSDGIMLILPAECRQLGKLSRMILIDQQCIIMCNH